MAKKFFPTDWETISQEEMIRARARLSGFIESIPDKERSIREVSIIGQVCRTLPCDTAMKVESTIEGVCPQLVGLWAIIKIHGLWDHGGQKKAMLVLLPVVMRTTDG